MFAVLLCVPIAAPPVNLQSPQFYEHWVFVRLIERVDYPIVNRVCFGCPRDDTNLTSILRDFNQTGGVPMRGITFPKTLTLTPNEPFPEWEWMWRHLGVWPVASQGE